MTENEQNEKKHILLKVVPMIAYVFAEIFDQFLMGVGTVKAIGFGLFAAVFFLFIVEGWGLIAYELYMFIFSKRNNKKTSGVITACICILCGFIDYKFYKLIFVFAGYWTAGKVMSVALNGVYAVIIFLIALIPSDKL